MVALFHAIIPHIHCGTNVGKAFRTVKCLYGRAQAVLGRLRAERLQMVRLRSYYQFRLAEIYKLSIPPGMRVLELGCGDGGLLAKLDPAYGYGLDLSLGLIERAGATILVCTLRWETQAPLS